MISPEELAKAKSALAKIARPAPITNEQATATLEKVSKSKLKKDIETESVFERPAYDYRESMSTLMLKLLFRELKKLDRDDEQENRFNRIKTILNNRNIANIK